MPREYHHIQNYEKEILELKAQGYTLRAIGEKLVSHTNKCTTSLRDIILNKENLRQE